MRFKGKWDTDTSGIGDSLLLFEEKCRIISDKLFQKLFEGKPYENCIID